MMGYKFIVFMSFLHRRSNNITETLIYSAKNIFQILDLLEGHPLFTLSGHTSGVNTVAFSPTGDAFASAGDDKLVSFITH